jgi:hypothetical protein
MLCTSHADYYLLFNKALFNTARFLIAYYYNYPTELNGYIPGAAYFFHAIFIDLPAYCCHHNYYQCFMWYKSFKKYAPSEDRTHDLKIMRLTRCLLRYRGLGRGGK